MKRIIVSVLLTVLILMMTVMTAFSSSAAVIGDVDGDGVLAILDVTAIQQHLAKLITLTPAQEKAGMVENGEVLAITDATLIQQKLAFLIDRFPVEGEPTESTAAPASETQAQTQQPATQAPTQPQTQPQTQPETQAPTEKETVAPMENNVTVYFSNNLKWSKVNAYVYNDATGTPMTAWPGKAMTKHAKNNEGEDVYKITVDTTQYDRIIFNNGTDQTTNTPITKANSGYFIQTTPNRKYGGKYIAGVYPYGQSGEGNVKTISMNYPDGYKKRIYIWTPEGYNANDKSKKYSVLYMCDGQNLFGQASTLSGYEWECDETVLSMMQNGGDGVIVVGVEAGNTSNLRDHELTPNLGKTAPGVNTYGSYSNGGGKVFSDFVVDTVIPYVEQNYNTNSIRGIAGSSSGGIEAFYIGIEHMDKFRYIGALSPAFILYEKATWDNYLKTKDFSGDVPRIYFFCGKSADDQLEQMLYTNAVAMEGWLKSHGYPAAKMTTRTDDDATHSEGFWALYFPEALAYGLGV